VPDVAHDQRGVDPHRGTPVSGGAGTSHAQYPSGGSVGDDLDRAAGVLDLPRPGGSETSRSLTSRTPSTRKENRGFAGQDAARLSTLMPTESAAWLSRMPVNERAGRRRRVGSARKWTTAPSSCAESGPTNHMSPMVRLRSQVPVRRSWDSTNVTV
jgi:hypothetical protein